jgi:DNA-binding transcriptional LysR family regulator
MDLRDLQLFVATIEHGSILRAAGAENISQPALTRRLKNLENDLKVSLIERTSRGARPTPDGLLIYERACALVSEAKRLRHDVRALSGGAIGKLAVGIGIGCEAVFGTVLAGFSARHPAIDLTVHVDFHEALVAQMRAGRLALAFAIDPLESRLPEFQTSYVGELVSGLACRAGHPLLALKEITTADLAEARWAVWDSPSAARYLQSFYLRHGLGSPAIAIRSNSSVIMMAAVLETDAIAVMPEYLMREQVANDRIAMLDTPLGTYFNRLVAVHPEQRHMPSASHGLIRMVRDAIGGTCIGPPISTQG